MTLRQWNAKMAREDRRRERERAHGEGLRQANRARYDPEREHGTA